MSSDILSKGNGFYLVDKGSSYTVYDADMLDVYELEKNQMRVKIINELNHFFQN